MQGSFSGGMSGIASIWQPSESKLYTLRKPHLVEMVVEEFEKEEYLAMCLVEVKGAVPPTSPVHSSWLIATSPSSPPGVGSIAVSMVLH